MKDRKKLPKNNNKIIWSAIPVKPDTKRKLAHLRIDKGCTYDELIRDKFGW